MKTNKILKTILIWLPSLIVALFYIPNAMDKLLNPNQTGKIVQSSAVMITAGIYILLSLALFLYNKTMILGSFLLSLYMVSIISIHLYKGKPAEILILLLMSTIFAAYIRKPQYFN
ncbi:hypothetical protein [Aureivirga sp. CE67]|uniref:hypothetical protein n=1 Tax=Aureivirga sp. CE67 TaxID=1788983 RepID=UPI0018CAA89E|nr:hypothetical protein [Aureivirga sp. CE67]